MITFTPITSIDLFNLEEYTFRLKGYFAQDKKQAILLDYEDVEDRYTSYGFEGMDIFRFTPQYICYADNIYRIKYCPSHDPIYTWGIHSCFIRLDKYNPTLGFQRSNTIEIFGRDDIYNILELLIQEKNNATSHNTWDIKIYNDNLIKIESIYFFKGSKIKDWKTLEIIKGINNDT